MSNEEKLLIQTRVSKKLFNQVVILAKEAGCSVATFVRQLLIKEIKDNEPAGWVSRKRIARSGDSLR